MDNKTHLYGIVADDALQIELEAIRRGGNWVSKTSGKSYGLGLFEHYRNAQKLLWPQEDHHRWSDLILREIIQNSVTCITGPKDTGKTQGMAKYALVDYWAFPEETLILMSSTDIRGLELRVWGALKTLFDTARQNYPWLAGYPVDSKHAICTDDLKEDGLRDMRKGIICIPCKNSAGKYIGLGSYVGIKQKRRRLLADECQFLPGIFIEALANYLSGEFKAVLAGNPLGQEDALDKASEPAVGWSSQPEPDKTVVWPNRFMDGHTIDLVGTDSPNFDPPILKKPRYPYLIHQNSIDRVVKFYGVDSMAYYSQCKGVRRSGLNAHRVITRELCEQFHAFDPITWEGHSSIKKIASGDIAYGGVGGDRCVGGHIEFGKCADGKTRINVVMPQVVPISLRSGVRAEDQIAGWFMQYCSENDIPPQDCFYDSTGRGAMGSAFARVWSVCEPVEFGGVPTDRPVSMDLMIWDSEKGVKRPITCREHFSKFVSELWFMLRYAIESDQIRGLPLEVAEDGFLREWGMVRDNKIEVESKKKTKERMGRSPDLFDWLVTALEGARRRGFEITKFGDSDFHRADRDWVQQLHRKSLRFYQRQSLTYTS